MGTINAGRALHDGDFAGVVGENNGIARRSGIAFHLVETRSGRYILGIGPATEAEALSGGGGVESLLRGPPRSGKRARMGVGAGRRNIERACSGPSAATCCL